MVKGNGSGATARAEAILALGGNLGDVRETFDQAVDLLCRDGRVKIRVQSSDFRTPAWGVEDQDPFINRCIIVDTDLEPRTLLGRALAVERTLGRDRSHERRWGPRPIDIDVLCYDGLAIDEPGLTLPHPRWWQRAFVLVPLAEIAPERRIGGLRVREALARVDTTGIERLAPGESED
jgi:2-amino-4-hydroxy-6-hydroxymethyldihydropteridine diphosphokinase